MRHPAQGGERKRMLPDLMSQSSTFIMRELIELLKPREEADLAATALPAKVKEAIRIEAQRRGYTSAELVEHALEQFRKHDAPANHQQPLRRPVSTRRPGRRNAL